MGKRLTDKKTHVVLAVTLLLLASGYGFSGAANFNSGGNLRSHYREWPGLESARFLVRYSPADRALAGRVAEEADLAAAKVARLLPHAMPADKPWLIIVPDQSTMKKAFGWGEGGGALGVYLAHTIKVLSPRAWHWLPVRDRVAVFAAEGPLVHEYTHYVLDLRTGGNYPYWFSEGLAQLTEYKINGYQWLEEDSSLAAGTFTPKALDRALNRPDTQARAYRQSLSLVTYLEALQGMDGLNRLIDGLGEGVPFDWALKKVYGLDQSGLWQQWELYCLADSRWFLPSGRK